VIITITVSTIDPCSHVEEHRPSSSSFVVVTCSKRRAGATGRGMDEMLWALKYLWVYLKTDNMIKAMV
jgi:hypothetical protein